MFPRRQLGKVAIVSFPRPQLIAALLLAPLVATLSLALVHRGGATRAATASSGPEMGCTPRLLRDWADGRIDRTYPIRCYRQALRMMPVDLEVYSSAPDDITHALSQRIVQNAGKPKGARTVG
jgi:hypothetical protein